MARCHFEKLMLPPTATIKDAIQTLTVEGGGIILVTDHGRRLLGVVVDSDIRKAFLKGFDLKTPIKEFMTFKPFTLPYGISQNDIRSAFMKHPRAFIPLVNKGGQVRELACLDEFFKIEAERTNWIVLMAGGLGTRLRPMTDHCPKAMVTVGSKPVLETIVEQFVEQGFRNFMVAVNHLGDQIKRHFGDGSRWGIHIEYLDEKEPMGTAGALSMIQREMKDPFIVMNGDLLTKMDFNRLLEFHEMEKGKATVCIREYNIQIPFGVIAVENGRLQSIDEKPTHRFFVNAGIYVVDPSVMGLPGLARPMDMPWLLEKVVERWPNSIACFPITEYWLDIGRFDDYERAKNEYSEVFKR